MLDYERLEHLITQAQEAAALSPDMLLHTAQHAGMNGVYQLGLKHMAEYLYRKAEKGREREKEEEDTEVARQALDTNIRHI